VLDESVGLAQTADLLAELDVLAGWALLSREWDYTRPELDEGSVLEIDRGPASGCGADAQGSANTFVTGSGGAFVPNDTLAGRAMTAPRSP
jgi:DNA mismatch repair protein MutS